MCTMVIYVSVGPDHRCTLGPSPPPQLSSVSHKHTRFNAPDDGCPVPPSSTSILLLPPIIFPPSNQASILLAPAQPAAPSRLLVVTRNRSSCSCSRICVSPGKGSSLDHTPHPLIPAGAGTRITDNTGPLLPSSSRMISWPTSCTLPVTDTSRNVSCSPIVSGFSG